VIFWFYNLNIILLVSNIAVRICRRNMVDTSATKQHILQLKV